MRRRLVLGVTTHECVFVEEVAVGLFGRLRSSRLHDEPDVLETLAEEEHGDVDGDGTSSLDDQDLQSLARSRSTRTTRHVW